VCLFLCIRGISSEELQFDLEIEKTARANRKAVKQAKQAARLATLEQSSQEEEDTSSPYISEEELIEMAEANPSPPPPPPPRRTLGDYGQRNDGEIANLG
ncbi:hypothetical protein A2U01_0072059, partial [Trifolium medium]|nr:hypothetical protein [Trifolium medium]